MNEQELNYRVEANDFAGELSDEALDRSSIRISCDAFGQCAVR
jgi:hypothetical protein